MSEFYIVKVQEEWYTVIHNKCNEDCDAFSHTNQAFHCELCNKMVPKEIMFQVALLDRWWQI